MSDLDRIANDVDAAASLVSTADHLMKDRSTHAAIGGGACLSLAITQLARLGIWVKGLAESHRNLPPPPPPPPPRALFQDATVAFVKQSWPEASSALCGAELIARERRRQLEVEGWSSGHDDEHDQGEMAKAAAAYVLRPYRRGIVRLWPWSRDWWKPTPDDRIAELAKAGALIAAEIDRIKREAPRNG